MWMAAKGSGSLRREREREGAESVLDFDPERGAGLTANTSRLMSSSVKSEGGRTLAPSKMSERGSHAGRAHQQLRLQKMGRGFSK